MTSDKSKKLKSLKRQPTDRLEYWHSCKVEYSENGNTKHAVTKGINHRDVLQLAREAAKYVFAQYAWTRTLKPNTDLEQGDFSILFTQTEGPLVVAIKVSGFRNTHENRGFLITDEFAEEFCRYLQFMREF